MSDFLPFALPDIGEAEIAEVVDSLRSGWLTTGPKAKRFESAFAEFVGANTALAVNSATAGMHLALEAIGVGPGDKVVVPVYTFTATAEVVRYLGADPIFVDVEPDTCNMDVSALEQALQRHPEVKAIMPVHFAGHPCKVKQIYTLAQQYSVRVVEDAAHAFPTEYEGQFIGGFGDIAVYSFYVTKTLATGEGGMVVCREPELVPRMSAMRLHGINRDVFDRYTSNKPSWYYEVVAPGFKYNMTDLAASIGLHQLARAEEMRRAREDIAKAYMDAFSGSGLVLPSVQSYCTKHSWHLFVIQLPDSVNRDEFIQEMADKGVGTSVHFIPLHLQPYWRDRYALDPKDFPVADSVFKKVVSLPIYPRMSSGDVSRVIDAVHSLLREAG